MLLWLKCLNYTHARALHEQTPEVLQDVSKYKHSFKIRKSSSTRLQGAGDLLEQGDINIKEFEELRRIDQDMKRSSLFESADNLCNAVMHLEFDMQTVISILQSSATSDNDSLVSFQQLSFKCLEVADKSPNIFEFYLPQILQIHSLIARSRPSEMSLQKLDCLQQVLISICAMYPAIALKTIWSLVAICSSDYTNKRSTQIQYAASMCLLIQIELIAIGDLSYLHSSSVPLSENVKDPLLMMSAHQMRDLFAELSILFRVRHQLLVINERERLLGQKISNDMKAQQYQVADRDGSSEACPRPLADDLAELHDNEDCFLLTSDRSLKLVLPKSSCLNILYSLGTVDVSGSLVVLSDAARRYMYESDVRTFPRNILSFEVPSKGVSVVDTVLDDDGSSSSSLSSSSTQLQPVGDEDGIYLESNIRNPAPPFSSIRCVPYREQLIAYLFFSYSPIQNLLVGLWACRNSCD